MEFDLEDPSQCSLYIQMHFPSDQREQVRKVADFFVQTLKREANRKTSFCEQFRKKVLSAKLLDTKDGRRAWFKAWQSNRNARYVSLPAK